MLIILFRYLNAFLKWINKKPNFFCKKTHSEHNYSNLSSKVGALIIQSISDITQLEAKKLYNVQAKKRGKNNSLKKLEMIRIFNKFSDKQTFALPRLKTYIPYIVFETPAKKRINLILFF